jgi:PAS domain S-box-containing protein
VLRGLLPQALDRFEPGGRCLKTPADAVPAAFLAADGEMAALIRAHDWASTSLGAPVGWSPSLKAMVRMALTTRHPIFIFWGPEHLCLYNDGYRASLGPEKHPAILGMPGRQAWPEIWHIIGPQIELVMRGHGATWHENQLVPILRHGELRDVYWTYSYGPIDDAQAADGVGGVLVIVTETTARIEAEHRLASELAQFARLFEQAPSFMAVLSGPRHVFEFVNPGYMRLIGHRPVLGRPVAEALPDAVQQGYLQLLDEVYRSGRAFVASGAQYVWQEADGRRIERYLDFVYQPITDSDGQVSGIFVNGQDATERHRSELALRQSEERLRLASEAAGLAVFLYDAAHDRVVWENDRPVEMFGLLPGDMPGAATAFCEELLHPDDIGAFKAAVKGSFTGRGPFRVECRVLRLPDRALRWIEFAGRLQTAAPGAAPVLIGTAADVTHRHQAEERERRAAAEARGAAVANAKFRTLFEQGSFFAAVLATDGTVLEVNRLLLQAGGLARAEVLGRKFWDCAWWRDAPGLQQRVREGCALAAAGEAFRIESPYLGTDGRRREVDLAIAPIKDDAGQVVFLAPTGRDITEAKRAESELRRLATELAESDRRKNEFLATLAHELRNPLAPLRNGLQLMRLAEDNLATIARSREMMERQLAQLVRLVDDLLDIARISGGKIDLQRQRITLDAMLASAVETSLPLIEHGHHALTVELPEEPLLIDADPARMAQVVSNLLNNAARYTPPGGQIRISAQREGGEVLLRISDNGIGIPADALEAVFEMFTQAGHGSERAQGGLGIGLSLVRRLVELHGGSVVAGSAGPGQGSTLQVRLPLAEQDAAASVPAPDAPGQPQARPALCVLVVDDNRDAADSFGALLSLNGHAAWVAHDAPQALAQAQLHRPQLVFLDLGMPGRNGFELAQDLRALPGMAEAVLVALTGWGGEADRQRSRAAGFDAHLTKPAEPEAVEALVARAALRLRDPTA